MNRAPAFAVFLCLTFLLVIPSTSHAIPITSLPGTEGIASFTGDLTYNSTDRILTLEITNTTDASANEYLVAIAFNNPDDAITDVELTPSPANFGLIGDRSFDNKIKAEPFGKFDIGASIGDDWKNAGVPTDGIGSGATGIFMFEFEGDGSGSLTEQDFIDALSDNKKKEGQFLAVRFKGTTDNSDKVPGTLSLPEPSTMLLLGMGLIGLAGISRKKFRK